MPVMGRKILITGGKGGVGKTTATASIGRCLASSGEKTVLVDGDIGLNNLDVALRVESDILYDIGDVVSGKATLTQAVIKVEQNLYLLPSVTACSSIVDDDSFAEVTQELSRAFGYLIIDCPAGIERSFLRAAGCADEAIIVTTPHLSCVRDGYKTSKILSGLGYEKISLIINRFNSAAADKGLSLSPEDITQALRLPLIGVVPESASVDTEGVVEPTDKRNAAAISYRLIAGYIAGRSTKIYDCRKKTFGALWQKIKESV